MIFGTKCSRELENLSGWLGWGSLILDAKLAAVTLLREVRENLRAVAEVLEPLLAWPLFGRDLF